VEISNFLDATNSYIFAQANHRSGVCSFLLKQSSIVELNIFWFSVKINGTVSVYVLINCLI